MSLSVTEIVFILGTVLSGAFAIHQWWGKRKLQILETARIKAETKAAKANASAADAQAASSMVEVVNVIMGSLNLFREDINVGMQSLSDQLRDHAKSDEDNINMVYNELSRIKEMVSGGLDNTV